MTLAFWIPRPRLFLKDEKTHWGVSASTRPMLEANLEKGARDVSSFHFWGCHLDGRRGLVRTNPGRLWPLAFITARVAMLGLVTHSLLQSLVGSWTSVFMLRRRCLSLFELCFAALRGTPEKHVIRLSPALADELWTWVLISPVCMANLRAPVLDTLYANDASDHLLAAVAAPLPPKVAKEAYRHCPVKGAWSRLLPQAQALLRSRASLPEGLELPDGENFTPHPLWRKLLRSLQFRTCWVARGRPSQHINVKELKAYLTLERNVAERCSSVRLLALLDSQVALAALLKGRSASPALNPSVPTCTLASHLQSRRTMSPTTQHESLTPECLARPFRIGSAPSLSATPASLTSGSRGRPTSRPQGRLKLSSLRTLSGSFLPLLAALLQGPTCSLTGFFSGGPVSLDCHQARLAM